MHLQRIHEFPAKSLETNSIGDHERSHQANLAERLETNGGDDITTFLRDEGKMFRDEIFGRQSCVGKHRLDGSVIGRAGFANLHCTASRLRRARSSARQTELPAEASRGDGRPIVSSGSRNWLP